MIEKFVTALLQEFSDKIELKTFQRNAFLTVEGGSENYVYWVQTGAVRVFFVTEFEEHTIRFGYKGSLINSLIAFVRETPSEFYIQAIRKTTAYAIPKPIFQVFLNQNVERIKTYNQILEALVVQQIEREIDILTFSPIERLKRVQTRSPQLFQEIPAKYIASYLRMSPETLSRIRYS